jgi:hypothetical protein
VRTLTIVRLAQLDPDRLNDAVELLEESGLVEASHYLGTVPYAFADVSLTARGRVQAEQLSKTIPAKSPAPPTGIPSQAPISTMIPAPLGLPVGPVGSPYGFKDEDWEAVVLDHSRKDSLIVVFGHCWNSSLFKVEQLRANVKVMFEQALSAVSGRPPNPRASLDFRILQGGYGNHLFNEIARDILGADMAVFDTSDLSPNVMIELGVALTWGIRTLVIRDDAAPKPPSDISGQTWATYQDSGASWPDSDHQRKLEKAVERAVRKKYRPSPGATG